MKFLLCLFLVTSAFADDFCERSRSPQFASIQLENSENHLSFRNQGGLINGGVCWWHSRFTRNATYLVRFVPEIQRPQSIKALTKDIRRGKRVIDIYGYENLKEWSQKHKTEIQKELEKWQIIDGFIRQQWVVGLYGVSRYPASKLQARVEHLYDYVKQNNIAYLKLQIKGIMAHSWLIRDMNKMPWGYRLRVIDSNYGSEFYYDYKFGDRSFHMRVYGDFIPYLGKKKELTRIKQIRKSFCQAELL